MSKYRVGDIVIVKDGKSLPEINYRAKMRQFVGKKFTIYYIDRWCYLKDVNGFKNEWSWHEKWLEPANPNSNQFNDKCKWCKIKTKKKKIKSVNYTFNYCPKCGR